MHPDFGIPVDEIRKAGKHDEFRSARETVQKYFGPMYEEAVQILAQEDPLGLVHGGAPKDEYEPEAVTILIRLHEATSEGDLRRIAHEEFAEWFGVELAGGESNFEGVARRLWAVVAPTSRSS